ncbi:seipin-3-like [Hibiscus syriacus]|uniref:seipin-3-like n=1 Tax=Hibiscus syriacus TaxID=106335 RepID=UPI0019236294|nr:seipin-3-like [Hibiscus syriacus]
MLRCKSQTLCFAETVINSIPRMTGHRSESQVLNVKMNESTEGLEPTTYMKVILEQRAEFQPGAGIPEVYAASVALESELPRLKQMIWNWRRTIFVCISIMLSLTESVTVLVLYRSMITPNGMPWIGLFSEKVVSQSKLMSWYKISRQAVKDDRLKGFIFFFKKMKQRK